jgi:UDPglucose 6-dehydrogenase
MVEKKLPAKDRGTAAVLPVIAIAGCGYVGLTTAAILANCGYTVYAIEPLQDRLTAIKDGRSFFYEAGIDPLIAEGIRTERLLPTATYDEALAKSDIVFCCMGTPDNPDGSTNLTYVFNVAEQFIQHHKAGAIFVQKSTVPVGTGDRIRESFIKADTREPYVSNPEFLREGTAIIDTLWADRVVVGSDDAKAADLVLDLYKDIEKQRQTIAKLAGLATPVGRQQAVDYVQTKQNAAELVKVSANAFLALKVSFANSIAKLADKTGADIREVMDAVGSDNRIGRSFFNAGRGYGGGCFPKDVLGIIRSAEEYGVELSIMMAAHDLNASMPHYILSKVEHQLGGQQPLQNKSVAVLGLSFKAGTSDTRRSPAVEIANTLVERGAAVSVYDPAAMEEAASRLPTAVKLSKDLEAAIKNVDIVFVATDWPEFKKLDFAWFRTVSKASLVVDCMNCLDATSVRAQGLAYIGVGTGERPEQLHSLGD